MNAADLESESIEDDKYIDYKIEIAQDDDMQTVNSEKHAVECGRIYLHVEDNTWSFNCFFCESSFNEISDLKQHVSDLHTELISYEYEWEMIDSTTNDHAVDLEIIPIAEIKEEGLNIDETDTSTIDDEFYVESIEGSKPSQTNYPLQCEYCHKGFRYQSKLRDHITIHTGVLAFKCDKCPKAFRTSDVLRFHRAVHDQEKSFKCHHCDQSFRLKRYLQMHLRYHLSGKTFACKICGKSHRTSGQLKVHMTKHDAKKEYICEICGACYRLRQHLIIHLKQKHENKREFKCDQCDKAFNTIGFLNQHKVSHSKERIHICSVCDMGFIWRKNLLEHLKLHSGLKNYKCEICGKAFAQRSGLISHVKTHAWATFKEEVDSIY